NGALTRQTDINGTTTYTWDARDRLIAITGPGVSAGFVYDALGRRRSKTIDGVTTVHGYDGLDIVTELVGGQTAATYLRGLNVDEPFVRRGATSEFYHADALGSVLALSGETGVPQTTYTYDPFGNATSNGAPSLNPFQFTGRENDGTGLYYYRARYQRPAFARFVSEDPMREAAGVNMYSYAADNPAAYVDPLGLWCWSVFSRSFGESFKAGNEEFARFSQTSTRKFGSFIVKTALGASATIETDL